MLIEQVAASGLLLSLVATTLWVASLRLRDASVIDVFWGPFFMLIAITGLVVGPGGSRALLVAALVAIWASRLAFHLGWRNVGKGEDPRYRAMRESGPGPFALRSLLTVFLLQVAIALVVALPLHAVMASSRHISLGILDVLGAALSSLGIVIEAVADAQLSRFKSNEENRGRVLDSGLWRYTRHPNYFGDFCFWWGLGLLGLSVAPWWTLIGPALMSFLLLRVSGVTLLERTIDARRPDYAAYKRRTSAFFPWPPRPNWVRFSPCTPSKKR